MSATTQTDKTRAQNGLDGAPHADDSSVLQRLYAEVKPYWRAIAGAFALFVPLTLAQLAQPLIIGEAVDGGFKTGNMGVIAQWAGLYLLAVTGRAAVQMAQLFLMQWTGQRAVRAVRNRLFAKIQRLPMSTFDKTPLGAIMTRIVNDVESFAELFASGAVNIFADLLFLLGTLVMLLWVDVKLSMATLAMMPILVIGMLVFRTLAKRAFRAVRSKLSGLNAQLQELLSGMHIVQLFGQTERIIDAFDEDNTAFMKANRQAVLVDASVYAFVDAMSHVTTAAVLLFAAGFEPGSAVEIGVLVAFIEALGRFFMPVRELSNKFAVIQSALVAAERIYALEDEPEPFVEPENPVPAVFEETLRFEDVNFAYADGPRVLDGVSFEVKRGERVALVGHTGAGKSTVVKLACRLYDVTDGRIALDGVDVRDMATAAYRGLFTVVPQDVFLFEGTLRDNLRFGRQSATDAEILAAVSACQASALVARGGGLDGHVDARGRNFSLGERQLLALARALVANPQILILDEATASIDRSTERHLQEATEALIAGRTALIVAHRLSTIRACDRILVFHGGKLVESGTHDDLMAARGRYQALVELQLREEEAALG